MEIYCATTIMVIGQFFENPFSAESESNDFKRPLSPFSLSEDDEDEQVETSPQKKRKFSF
jgi:hypothetical protein